MDLTGRSERCKKFQNNKRCILAAGHEREGKACDFSNKDVNAAGSGPATSSHDIRGIDEALDK